MSNKEQVVKIDRNISENAWMQSLDDKHRLSWIMLLHRACDDQGHFALNCKTLRNYVFFGDLLSDDEIKQIINDFVEAKHLLAYEVLDRQYYEVVNWWNYQEAQYQANHFTRFPPPEGKGVEYRPTAADIKDWEAYREEKLKHL